MTITNLNKFDWTEELHKTVVQSLTTTFGLDFLLLEDKKGGDVDTIHKARVWQNEVKEIGKSDIHVSDEMRSKINEKGKNADNYDSKLYHSHSNYKAQGEKDNTLHDNGKLYDLYLNRNLKRSESRQLDHKISSDEVHNDAGRLLSDVDGVQIANEDSNFASTHWYINNAKREHSAEKFVNEVVPNKISGKTKENLDLKDKLKRMPSGSPEERDKRRRVQDKIRKNEEHINVLEQIDKKSMLEADKEARDAYNKTINEKYYKSSKFLKNSAMASAKQGLQMGVRQAIGLVLAELWFELKQAIPKIYRKCKRHFELGKFIHEVQKTIANIWNRIRKRFKDLFQEFLGGSLGGALSSLNTTILNIFLATEKMIGKLLRELWTSITKTAKLIFFNPDKLSSTDLAKAVLQTLSLGVATAVGVILNGYLASIFVFPFGQELAAFISALVTGILTLGATYFLEHSDVMRKVWKFLDSMKSKYQKHLEYYQNVNKELDRYLLELSKVEFNLDTKELESFAIALSDANSEYERGIAITAEVDRRNIDLPFKSGDKKSVRKWLSDL